LTPAELTIIGLLLGAAALLTVVLRRSHARLKSELRRTDQRVRALGKQHLLIQAALYESVARHTLADAGRAPVRAVRFLAQYGEDVLAWEILGRPLNGTYIEIGANDGVTYSVSYALECMGWRGLLVEAHPDLAEECRAQRPGSLVVHAACGRAGAESITMNLPADPRDRRA
jgi:hypothetical protein